MRMPLTTTLCVMQQILWPELIYLNSIFVRSRVLTEYHELTSFMTMSSPLRCRMTVLGLNYSVIRQSRVTQSQREPNCYLIFHPLMSPIMYNGKASEHNAYCFQDLKCSAQGTEVEVYLDECNLQSESCAVWRKLYNNIHGARAKDTFTAN